MRRRYFETQLGPDVAYQWRRHFPKTYARLEERGQVEKLADAAADNAASQLVGFLEHAPFPDALRVALDGAFYSYLAVHGYLDPEEQRDEIPRPPVRKSPFLASIVPPLRKKGAGA